LFVTTVSANCATFISDLSFAQVVVIWFPVLLRLQYIQKILQLMHQLWVLLLVTASPLLGNFHRRGTRNMVCTGALLVLQSESEKKGNKLCVCHTVIAEHPWRACLYNYITTWDAISCCEHTCCVRCMNRHECCHWPGSGRNGYTYLAVSAWDATGGPQPRPCSTLPMTGIQGC
jgi:hypothetical protein